MKKLIFIILSIILISCNQKSVPKKHGLDADLVTEKVTYEVLNTVLENILKENEIETTYLAYEDSFLENKQDDNDYMGISKMDTLFSKKDVKYILEQNRTRMNFSLKKNLLKNIILIPSDTILKLSKRTNGVNNFWTAYERKYGMKGFYSISKPLFSIDQKTVIISYGFHCGGLCGGGSTVILKKINGKWKHIAELQNWVS